MRRVYKSADVALSQEDFRVTAPPSQTAKPTPREDDPEQDPAEPAEVLEEPMISDDSPVMLNPARVEQIFTDAKRQAAQIIHEAREQAKQEAEVTRISAQMEAQELRQNAYLEGQSSGFAEGAAAKVNQIEQCLEKLQNTVGELEGKLDGTITQYEGDLKWAVAQVASKVLHRMVEQDELALTELVKAAVDQVRGEPWINLHLSAQSAELIDRLERELAPLRQLEIVPDDLPPGSCLLDLPGGKLDASIDAQLENLRDYFKFHGNELE